MNAIIVSRHPAAIEFIAECLSDNECGIECRPIPSHAACGYRGVRCGIPIIPVIESATAEDVRGKTVYGNLPLHLAALAESVHAIEFSGTPPRGTEYTLVDMHAAGARLVEYVVRPVATDGDETE
jgi:hypothetical protein